MESVLTYDPVLNLVVKVLSRIEGREVDYRDLSMAAIVRNGYYIGLSYKSDKTFVIWRTGTETVEFYDRESWMLLESVQVEENASVASENSEELPVAHVA